MKAPCKRCGVSPLDRIIIRGLCDQCRTNKRTCNLHKDCDAMDEMVRAAGGREVGRGSYMGPRIVMTAAHCHSDDCEDCFGC